MIWAQNGSLVNRLKHLFEKLKQTHTATSSNYAVQSVRLAIFQRYSSVAMNGRAKRDGAKICLKKNVF